MLSSEDTLNQNSHTHLILFPTRGIGYQTTGALARLGRKMLGLDLAESPSSSKSQSANTTKLPISYFSMTAPPLSLPPNQEFHSQLQREVQCAILGADFSIAEKRPLNSNEFSLWKELVTTLQTEQPKLRWILVVSHQTPPEQIQELKLLTKGQITFFLCPPLVGFRDLGLFDQTLDYSKNNLGYFFGPTQNEPIKTIFSGDLVSLIASAASDPKTQGRVFWIEGQPLNQQDWKRLWIKHFKIEAPGFLQKTFGAFRSNPNKIWPIGADEKTPKISDFSGLFVQDFLDYFPTAYTSWDRALEQCARSYQKDPHLELVFPPTRGL